MTDRDRYEARAFCVNCGYEGPVTPPVGIYIYAEPCPICRGKTLRSVAQREWERAMDDERA